MRKRIVFNIIFLLCFTSVIPSFANDAIGKSVLTMGRFSDKVFKAQKQIEPIITYLASKLEDVGVERGEVILVKDNKNVIEGLRDGKIDIVLETPFLAGCSLTKLTQEP